MQQQAESKAPLPPIPQDLIDRLSKAFEERGEKRGEERGEKRGEERGEQRGELKGRRDSLLRLLNRAGIQIDAEDVTRVQACTSVPTLEGWLENVIGAKTAADVFK